MTDIIANAKQLLEGVTSGEWRAADSDIIAEDSNRFIATVSEYSGLDELSEEYANVQLIAAAPDLAQVLAEEEWEFTAQVFMNQHWVFMWSPTSGNSVRGKWHATREIAEKFSEQWQLDYPIRIVRRRVSPVEVVG